MWTSDDQELQNSLSSMIPLSRIGRSTDIAPLVEFLAGSASSYIVGENCLASGGINVRL